jgi:hypothetical protein
MRTITSSTLQAGRPAAGRCIPDISRCVGALEALSPGGEIHASPIASLFRGYTVLSPAAWRRERLAALGPGDITTAACNSAACIRRWRGVAPSAKRRICGHESASIV